jgi:adenylate cyclase
MFVHHGFLVTYRVVIEQQERRRVRSVFSRIVSPEVVNELLGAEKLALGGARREVSVLFADVRGFTDLTDELQARAAKHVKQQGLTGGAAEAYFNEAARETLDTVNPYLALVADVVKQHHGTLDKYIGDCAMAFWGAPIPDDQHARHCVQAAIEAQRAILELNRQRTEQNGQLEQRNRARAAAGLPPAPSLATLTLGMGINTGYVTVGLMGSEDHLLNFTVFGHEVNLASRLEHEAGRGSILISEATFAQLQRGDPALARRCVPLKPVMVKGIRDAVKIYEVTWHSEEPPSGA